MGWESLGERIRSRREQLGLTQAELARVVGVPQSRLSEYECGKNQGMTLHTACKFAVALRCSIDYLAGLYEGYDAAMGATKAAPAAVASAPGEPRTRRRGRPRKAAPPMSAGARG